MNAEFAAVADTRRRFLDPSTLGLLLGVGVATVAMAVNVRLPWRAQPLEAAFVPNLWLARVFGVVLCGYLGFRLGGQVRRLARPSLGLFAWWLLVLGAAWFACFPGLMMTDSIATVHEVQSQRYSGWFSYLHPLLQSALFEVWPSVAVVGALQIVLTAAVMAYAGELVHRRVGSPWALVLLGLPALLPAVLGTTLLVTRDAIFGVLHLWLALRTYDHFSSEDRSFTRLAATELAAVTAWLSVYRGDGLFVFLAVVALLVWTRWRAGDRISVKRLAASFLVAFAVVRFVLPSLVVMDDTRARYTLSLFWNPLIYITEQADMRVPDATVMPAITRIIDLERAKEIGDHREIQGFWDNAWHGDVPPEAHAEFKTAALRLFAANPGYFLAGRWLTFASATALQGGGFFFIDLLEGERDAVGDWSGIPRPRPSPDLFKRFLAFLDGSIGYGTGPVYPAILWSCWPMLLALGAALVARRASAALQGFAFVLLSRVPFVFLAAPASQFKYYHSAYLGGCVLPLLVWAELSRRSRPKA